LAGKIAKMSNLRILNVTDDTVTISYKDYRSGGQQKTLTVSHCEFIRRLAQHILPKRFVRIRHYGILSSTWKRSKLFILQASLAKEEKTSPFTKNKSMLLKRCPCYKTGELIILLTFGRRGPPSDFQKEAYEKSTFPVL
jgi:hypothetical protein